MSAVPPTLAQLTTRALRRPTPAQRAAVLQLPVTHAAFQRVLAQHGDLFDRLESAPPPAPRAAPGGPMRIVFWNAERAKFIEPAARLLARLDAAAYLVCELDLGMARSGQAHTARELARRLGAGYAFGVEFLELGLGDARERAWHAGEVNRAGLHGAAILSPVPLERPALIRLELDGHWFDGSRGERRVGGRMAVAATLRLGERPVTLVAAHFESHSDPDHRAAQMRRLLAGIEAYAPGAPALIGGDLNTSTVSRDWARGTDEKPALPQGRVLDPVPHEPLFEVAAAAGFDWRACNQLGLATERIRPNGTPRPPLGKIDWFLARRLEVSDPQTIPAVDDAGTAISDHEVLAVAIRPGGR